jgi:flagellar protein FlaG
MVNIMSSELVVKAVPVQPPPQDATGNKRSQLQNQSLKVTPLNVKDSADDKTGKSLPTQGSGMPTIVSDTAPSKPLEQAKNNQLSHKEVLEAVQNLNDFVQNTRKELNFTVDEQTGKTIVKVIDHETKDVIRQIPAEEILDVARRIAEHNGEKGSLFKVKV